MNPNVMTDRRIPIAAPRLEGNELRYVTTCVESNWISSQGAYVGRFEQDFAEAIGARFAVSVSSGTTALHLALRVLDIGPGDEVLVPNLTFAATANAVIHCGARPVLVDVDPLTWTLDPADLEARLTPRSRAVVPVHLYGHPADMQAVMAVAERAGLAVVEDCAESAGSRAYGRTTGTIGDLGCFSFFANKIITTGEGGMITTDDEAVDERLRILRDHGMRPERRYWHVEAGYNYRLTNLQAAVGVAQMEQYDHFLDARTRLTAAYRRGLADVPGLTLPFEAPWSEPVTWLFAVVLDEATGSVDRVRAALSEAGIETRAFFYPLHEQPPYRPYVGPADAYPVSTRLAERGLCLPTYVGLSLEDVAYICEHLKQCLR